MGAAYVYRGRSKEEVAVGIEKLAAGPVKGGNGGFFPDFTLLEDGESMYDGHWVFCLEKVPDGWRAWVEEG